MSYLDRVLENASETLTLDNPVNFRGAVKINGTTIAATAAELNVLDGITASVAELNIVDGVTSTAAELNILDGVTATAAELNILDGVTATAAELNILDGVTATAAELNILDGVTSTAAELNILDGVTATAAELNKVGGIPTTGYLVSAAEVTFTQTTGDGTYTGTIPLPAGSTIIDVQVHGIALWDGDTTSSMVVGDGGTANGFFVATDLKATDLLAGEANTIEHQGGLGGAFIASEQRVLYSSGARNVIGVITQVGTGTTGRTRLVVLYVTPTAVAATKV